MDGLVVVISLSFLYGPHHVHTLQNLAKDHVLAVEPGRVGGGDVDLAAVGVWPPVGHTQPAGPVVPEHKVLIGEVSAVDTLEAEPVADDQVAALDHEVVDDPVEGTALVPERLAFLVDVALGEQQEVAHRLRGDVAHEAKEDATGGLSTDGDVKVHHIRDVGRALTGPTGGRTVGEHPLGVPLAFPPAGKLLAAGVVAETVHTGS